MDLHLRSRITTHIFMFYMQCYINSNLVLCAELVGIDTTKILEKKSNETKLGYIKYLYTTDFVLVRMALRPF